MDAKTAKLVLERRKKAKQTIDPNSLFDPKFPQQKAVVDDPAKLKAVWCTRRAAKSFTAGLYLVYECLKNPGCNCLFLGLSRASAKGIIWKDILRVLNKRYKLHAKFNLAELTMTFPNGSVIYITGVDADEDEMNKLLGRKYRLACIDEASMYTIDVRNLVYGVLKPAMVDPNLGGERGSILLTGTSSNFIRGLFFDITTGKEPGWSLHTWTAHDNPYVSKAWEEELDEIKRERPLYMETPQYKQWYLNQWVVDESKLVYKFNELKNLYKTRPTNLHPEGWTYTLGVDLGYEDDSAFVLSGYHINDPHLYIIQTFNKPHMTFDDVVNQINVFMADPKTSPSRVIIDGSVKQAIETMRVRSKIPFEYADKQGKPEFIELLNSDLIQGKILISEACTNFINEMMALVWVTDGDRIRLPRKEHPALPNHICDAFLYNWRMAYHFHSTPAEQRLVVGSKEWYQKQSEDIWEHERENLERQSGENTGSWPSDPEGGNFGSF